ncbi:MAG: hypothetical protein ACK58L_10225 [Planctomycetota bacterium]
MSTVFLPNLFFEEELTAGAAGSSERRPSAAAMRLAADLSPVMGLLAERNEESYVLVGQGEVPSRIPSALSHVSFVTCDQWRTRTTRAASSQTRFVPWGWSSCAQQIAAFVGSVGSFPDVSIVEFVNSRRFLVPMDQLVERDADSEPRSVPMNQGTFSRLCSTLMDVEDGLSELAEQPNSAWVIKSNLSHATRNRILGRGPVLSEAHRRWLASQFRAEQPVALEPWVERVAECGLQFTISPGGGSGDIRFDGAAEMVTDSSGRYSGSWISSEAGPAWITPAVQYGFEVAHRMQLCGYFGPVGFDCMMFRDPEDGREKVRLCHDINARLTMGRVALSLRRYLGQNETGLWLHADAGRWEMVTEDGSSERGTVVQVNTRTGSSVRIVPTSPVMTGSKPTQLKTALLISGDRNALQSVSDEILWHTSNSHPGLLMEERQ